MKNISEWYIRFGEWSLKLFLLNLLWLLFSIAGLFVFGLFPATVALFAVIRKLTMDSREISIFKLFLHTFKNEFLKANLLGYIWAAIGLILFLDLRVLQQLQTTIFHQSLTIILYVIIFVFLLLSLYLLPIFVHFQLKKREYIKYAFVLAVGRPIQSILMIVAFLVTLYLMWSFPGIIPVFGASLLALVLMKMASISFPKLNSSEMEVNQ